MMKYDPLKAPDPKSWMALDEMERVMLVERYHKAAKIRLPNRRLHSIIHEVVENQIAMGDELPVHKTLQRLMSEGLDRHDAIHAIGSVLADLMYGMMKKEIGSYDAQDYKRRLQALNAKEWLESAE